MLLSAPLQSLKETSFARLYVAQAISLLGDAFTWLGIALLAFEFGGAHSARILATALTIRVTAFIIFGSYAGVLADRYSRKKILIITNLARMAIVFTFPFVTDVWQVYVLVFFLNISSAFFSPAYKACIPQLISQKENYANAIALSNGTWQLLGMLGPGLAGIMAVWWGSRQIFFFDAFTFIVSCAMLLPIPIKAVLNEKTQNRRAFSDNWKDILNGTKLLFMNSPIRFAVLIELVAAIAGAQILVNTVGHIKGDLLLTDKEYGWAMTAFGIGATIAAFTAYSLDRSKNKSMLLIAGAFMIAMAVSFCNFVPYIVLLMFWVVAGLGQSFALMPAQVLIAENIPLERQGKVYGSHFAWTHLWWAIGYILAGFTGTFFNNDNFLIGGLLTFGLLGMLCSYQFFKRSRPS